VKDTLESKVKHVWKYHPEMVVNRLPSLFPNAEYVLQSIGEFLGTKVHEAFKKVNP
jgi:hypothetical protein